MHGKTETVAVIPPGVECVKMCGADVMPLTKAEPTRLGGAPYSKVEVMRSWRSSAACIFAEIFFFPFS